LQTSAPTTLVCLRLIEGTEKEEQELHRKFKSIRRHGEWFRSTSKLTKYIASLAPKDLREGNRCGAKCRQFCVSCNRALDKSSRCVYHDCRAVLWEQAREMVIRVKRATGSARLLNELIQSTRNTKKQAAYYGGA
jgi:hypothetical protein